VKPARFSYEAPRTVAEAVSLLGDDAKVLAGGQSLVPAMNFRLARPATLVDINRIDGLDTVSVDGEVLTVGALARHRRFEQPVEGGPLGRLLALAAGNIGHLPIRVRGTLAGSLAHADPASEWCVIAHTLDADVVAQGPGGARVIPAAGFFHTIFTTALAADELLIEVRFPRLGAFHRVGFAEFSRRAGDFALVMAAAVIEVKDGVVTEARIGVGGASDVPVRPTEAEASLIGRPAVAESFAAAAEIASATIRPLEDIHASVEYRRDLVRAMVRRALVGAA
jgi:aerobic carbon-monoxide dehydrogenase medium subunit